MSTQSFEPAAVPLVAGLLPDLCVELSSLLMEANQPDLAGQVATLPIVSWCRCGTVSCQSFYTTYTTDYPVLDDSDPRDDATRHGHDGLDLLRLPCPGILGVQVVDGRIVVVIVRDRHDLVPKLARDVSQAIAPPIDHARDRGGQYHENRAQAEAEAAGQSTSDGGQDAHQVGR